MGKITDIDLWKVELDLAEKHKEEQFGKYTEREKLLAGENIQYYEQGFMPTDVETGRYVTTLNVIDAITSIIVPSLYFKNPRTQVTPNKTESEETSPIVAKTIDYYRKILEIEDINKRIIWDAYVLGYGVYKIGYSTQFGMDLKDEDFKKKQQKSLKDKALEAVGFKKPKPEEEPERKELDARIIAENPFIEYVSPFDFDIDPRATTLNDAMWVSHKVRKSVRAMKLNKKYKNTSMLRGIDPDSDRVNFSELGVSEMEEFRTILVYEIHYRNDGKWYLLTISNDNGSWAEHYHEESIYDLGEWQFDMLTFKRHGHALYPKSDISKIKSLQDRLTSTIDNILEQVDKFVPKIAFSTGDLTPNGKTALEFGGIGALVETNKNPNDVFKELGFTQLKVDLKMLIDEIITLITVQTGITRAQLTGMSASNTATEAQIEQGGQTLRLSDMTSSVQSYVNHQSRKLWKVIKQFVTLEDLQLINGVKGIDEKTGIPKYDWLTVSPRQSESMQKGDYDFNIEIGSTQKITLAVARKAFENMFNILARPDVIGMIQQQGQKVELAEILRKYFDLFPELGIDAGKIIHAITQGTQGLLAPQEPGPGGQTPGSTFNALETQQAQPAPTMGSEINRTF